MYMELAESRQVLTIFARQAPSARDQTLLDLSPDDDYVIVVFKKHYIAKKSACVLFMLRE